MLKCNVGKHERLLRIAVGIVFWTMPELVSFPSWAAGLAYLVGAVGLLTGVLGYCPAWHLLGKNTSQRNTTESHPT